MSSASHVQPSALDYRLESINSFHSRASRGGHPDMQQEPAWPEQQQHHQQQAQGLPWSLQAAKTQRMQQRQSSAMTGPSLPQGFTDAPPAASRPAMQNLPPIFSPHLFAFNNAPQGQYMTVTSGLSAPETARAAQQQGPEGPLKDNLPLGDERANARSNALGSLNSGTGFSPAPTPFNQGAQMLPGLNVDVVVKMAPNSGALAPTMQGNPAPDDRGRQQMRISPAQASALRHVSSAESREFQTEGFMAPTSPDATSGPVTRTRRRAASGRPKYKDYFTDDASLSDSAALDDEDDEEDDEDDDFLSEISMREGHYGMQSRNSSLQSADASHFKSSGMEGEEGRSSKRSAAAKKPRTKQLLCEQDPEAPGLTLEQRRKIRRRINNRASARRVRQKREEDLQKITGLVTRLDEERSRVMARASQFQSNCMQLAAQLKETRDRWQSTCATNVNLQRELMALRAQVSDWQKGNRQQSASNQQQPNQALQRQASVGGPAGPGTPRVPPPSNHGHRGDLAQDGSFDLGSFLAN